MAELTLSVPDISCDHCKQSIETALRAVDGVAMVDVHVAEKTVDVRYDEQRVQDAAISRTIEEQGFTVRAS